MRDIFSGTQARPSEGALDLALAMIGLDSVSSSGHAQRNEHPPWVELGDNDAFTKRREQFYFEFNYSI